MLRVIGCVLTSVCLYGTELDSSKSDLGVRLTLLLDTGSVIADRHEPRVPGLEYGPILCPISFHELVQLKRTQKRSIGFAGDNCNGTAKHARDYTSLLGHGDLYTR